VTTLTGQTLGCLATEPIQYDEPEGVGSRPLTMHRPTDRPLRNDGIWRYWLAAGETYRVEHDGDGWHVTCRTWIDGHTYRLADLDGQFTGTLPLGGRVVELVPGRSYEIRESEHYQWVLVELDGDRADRPAS
jgi:hypothetical protein